LFPDPLVGETHLGSFICADWELRVTGRCLKDDLHESADADFNDLKGVEIIKSFMKERFERTDDTRKVNKLQDGKLVWVLARGNDHRAGTWYDAEHRVVWLLAYRLHRSGESGDFFPYCQALSAAGDLLPTESDYEKLLTNRGSRFAFSVRIEAPLILRQAQEASGQEHKVMFGGRHGACLSVEYADELQQTTVAFRVDTVPTDHVAIILAAIHGDAAWELTDKVGSRTIGPLEVGFAHLFERK